MHSRAFSATSHAYVICLVLPPVIDTSETCHTRRKVQTAYHSLLASLCENYRLQVTACSTKLANLTARERLLEVPVMHFGLSYEFHHNLLECYPAIKRGARLAICFLSPVFTFCF